ncbi:malonyl-CoA synthase [Roseobacter sp. YSTF-M11]|uniref:Malonyl-CoA synthase n=1 Tax=Roseobacter insulae TaxID=2859783 RepID=A0A9X1FZK7_9RHOB|nr:malonyl-CoA synthase [Roseobacter insulae]MBW4709823.1 malonyl-CoA synthase [Roseobacter insulae]
MYEINHLAAALAAGAENRPETTFAIREDGSRLTHGELFGGAEAIASGLLRMGLQPDDRVTVQVEKSLDALQLYLGTVLAGGVFQPLNTAYTGAELAYFIEDAAPFLVVCDPNAEERTKDIAASTPARPRVETLAADGTGSLWDHAVSIDAFEPVARAADDLAAILYTSGTTGRSKGAMLTHGNLASNAVALKETWHYSESDVLIHALPIFHTHGLFVATNVTLVSGASMLFHTRFDAKAIMDDMARATVLMGVPTFYTRLLEQPGLAVAAKAMRLFISGSAPLLAETHKAWTDVTGHAILERYGMSETNMNSSNPYSGARRPGSVGLPLPGVDIRVADPETGRALPPGEIGSIEIRGPNVFKGYWNMPEKTAAEHRSDGYFITGDLGVFSEDGYLSIVGRAKDLIISGGYNVYPKEVETVLDQIDGVRESAVFSVPHPDLGEAVIAALVMKQNAALDDAKVETICREELARFKHPKRLLTLDALPRNTMGKVEKNKLQSQYAELFKLEAQT